MLLSISGVVRGTTPASSAGSRASKGLHARMEATYRGSRRFSRRGGARQVAYAAQPTSSADSSTSAEKNSTPPPDLQETVETSMLAAISGLLFSITVTLGIDGSFLFSYMLPFPIVMAALRRSSSAGWSVMWVSASLLLILLGPLRAITYLLSHALPAAVLATCWGLNLPWHWSVPLMSAAKMGCQLSSLALASLTMGEDLLSVALCSIGAMLDKAGLMLGNTAGAGASATFLYGAFAVALTLNSTLKAILMHIVYYVVLKTMRYKVPEGPAWVQRTMLPQTS